MVKIVDRNIQPVSAPNFIGLADRPVIPDLSSAKAVEGVGMIAEGLLNAFDFMNKDQIKKGINETLGTLNDKIVSDINNLGVLEQQKKQGVITAQQYWMQLDTKVRELKSKYPGYEDEIDTYVAKKTGNIPANALRKLLFSQQSTTKSTQDQLVREVRRRLFDALKEGAPISQETVNKIIENEDPEVAKKHFEELAKIVAQQGKLKRQKQILELESKALTVNDKRLDVQAQKIGASAYTTFVNSKAFSAKVQGLQDFYFEAIKDGQITREEAQRLTIGFSQLRTEFTQYLTKIFYEPSVKGQKSIAERIGHERVQKMIQQQLDLFDNTIYKPAVGGEITIFNFTKKLNEVAAESDEMEALASPVLRSLATLRKTVGPDVLKSLIDTNALGDIAQDINKFISVSKQVEALGLPAVQTGPEESRPKPLTKIIDETKTTAEQVGAANPEETTRKVTIDVINKSKQVLTDKKIPVWLRLNAARVLFSPDNASFLSKIASEERATTFNYILSKDVTEAIKELGAKDPRIVEDYNKWVTSNFFVLQNTHLNEIRKIKEQHPFYNINVNEDGTIDLQVNFDNIPEFAQNPQVLQAQYNSINRTFIEYNRAVDNYTKALKNLGVKNPERALLEFYRFNGFMPSESKLKQKEANKEIKTGMSDNHIKLAADIIKRFEGFRSKPYRDPTGTLTVGYGFTRDIKPMTKEEAEVRLVKEVSSFERGVSKIIGRDRWEQLSDNQKAALISFAYNVGLGNLRKSTLVKKIRQGDLRGAADEFLKWTKSKGKRLKGLVRRRQQERQLFIAGL